MVFLQNNLNLKVSQRQVLTPGLVQMVSVLALNKLELKEMINAEMIENPMLEELEETVAPLDEITGKEAEQERSAEDVTAEAERVEKDPFDEIDFGSYFQDYLDPGYRTSSNYEELDSPSFENFLSQPSTLTDHLLWQLGAVKLRQAVCDAAELIIGNLNEDGYLTASEEELVEMLLLAMHPARAEARQAAVAQATVAQFHDTAEQCHDPVPSPGQWTGIAAAADSELELASNPARDSTTRAVQDSIANFSSAHLTSAHLTSGTGTDSGGIGSNSDRPDGHGDVHGLDGHAKHNFASSLAANGQPEPRRSPEWRMAESAVAEAMAVVQQLDPLGVGTRNLRECLLAQIRYQRREAQLVLGRKQRMAEKALATDEDEEEEPPSETKSGEAAGLEARIPAASNGNSNGKRGGQSDLFEVAELIVGTHLQLLQRKDMRELGRVAGCGADVAQQAVEYIRTLDPRPGQRYNQGETRLIEPDVAFVKRDDEYIVVMNEEDMPSLRLSQAYRKLLRKENAEKDVRDYVKERYKSAIQLMRNIEQRKNTIRRTCESIVRRQAEFLERGVEAMRPMMIKEVAEEIGVHPSTVSRAVANKYVHTAQGVFELRFFFSESVSGPEGGGTPLMLLKRKVKKLIEEEDPRKPLTDDHLAALLQQQGIDVTRRTVAKYREDLRIPSTHQRRVRN